MMRVFGAVIVGVGITGFAVAQGVPDAAELSDAMGVCVAARAAWVPADASTKVVGWPPGYEGCADIGMADVAVRSGDGAVMAKMRAYAATRDLGAAVAAIRAKKK
jgi:hypothetical protein